MVPCGERNLEIPLLWILLFTAYLQKREENNNYVFLQDITTWNEVYFNYGHRKRWFKVRQFFSYTHMSVQISHFHVVVKFYKKNISVIIFTRQNRIFLTHWFPSSLMLWGGHSGILTRNNTMADFFHELITWKTRRCYCCYYCSGS